MAGGNSTTGTIAADGTYTAPLTLPTPNTVTVTATSVEDPTRSGSATVTLENAIPVITSVTPTMLTANMQFDMIVSGTGFVPGSIVNLGAIPLSTTYIAPTQLAAIGTPTLAQVGTVPVTVVNPDPGGSTSAPFNVQVVGPNSNITVTISPKTATLGAGNVQQFRGHGDGNIDLSVTWSVNGVNSGNSTVGTIDYLGQLHRAEQYRGPGKRDRNGHQQCEYREIRQRRRDADQSGTNAHVGHSFDAGTRLLPDHAERDGICEHVHGDVWRTADASDLRDSDHDHRDRHRVEHAGRHGPRESDEPRAGRRNIQLR